jgi:hypothetical protein
MVGMACGFGMELYLWQGTHVPWTWWVMIGTTVTFVVGWMTSAIAGGRPNETKGLQVDRAEGTENNCSLARDKMFSNGLV